MVIKLDKKTWRKREEDRSSPFILPIPVLQTCSIHSKYPIYGHLVDPLFVILLFCERDPTYENKHCFKENENWEEKTKRSNIGKRIWGRSVLHLSNNKQK